MMERIEFSNDITKFRSDDQYLVTLNIRSNLRARKTESPKDPSFSADQITSNIDPQMTTQSKRLNADSKYMRGPSAYILIHISHINSPRKANSA